MSNNVTHSLCSQNKAQKRNRSDDDEDEARQTKPPALRDTASQGANLQGLLQANQQPQQPPLQQLQQPQNSILQNLQGLLQANQQPQQPPLQQPQQAVTGTNAISSANQQANPFLANPILAYLANGNGAQPAQGFNLGALGYGLQQPQNHPAGVNNMTGRASLGANTLNLNGVQVDANLIRTLLMGQAQGSMPPQPAPAQIQSSSIPQTNYRPDPPAAGGGDPSAVAARPAIAPVPPVGAAALPFLQSLMAAGQFNASTLGSPAPPMAAATATAAAPRPRPHSHLVDNSGTRRQLLYVPSDDDSISPYQAFARQNIELFEAKEVDVQTGAQGRNKPVQLGQVGIRCIHCADLHPKLRARASVYYPSRLTVLYQAAQNIVNVHLPELCESIPPHIRQKLIQLDNKRSSVGGGKNYWSDTAQIQGIIDTENGLRFSDESKKKN